MRENRLSSLKHLLAQQPGRLSEVAREAARRTTLTHRVRQHLPADLSPHVLHISLDASGHAAVTVDSASWASRLRYEQQRVFDAIRAEGLTVSRLGIKVLPHA